MGDNGMARGSDLDAPYWIYCYGCALVRHSETNEERWYVHFAIGQGVDPLKRALALPWPRRKVALA